MFQREFATRLVAQPGDTVDSRVSVNTRNNFNPPPSVDSSVVRIEPRQKSVLSLLEKNFKTLQALQLTSEGFSDDKEMGSCVSSLGNQLGDLNVDIEEEEEEEKEKEEDEDEDEDEDDEMKMDDGDTKVSDFKDKVIGVLKLGGFEEKRSSKLAQADFMHLLALFNKAGIHFS